MRVTPSRKIVMQTGYKRVRSDKKLVDVAEFPIFESLDEAIAKFGGGEQGTKDVLDLVNTQNTTNILNDIRGRYNTELSDSKLDDMANEALFELPMEQLQGLHGNKEKIKAWKEEFKAKAKETGGANAANRITPEQAVEKEKALIAEGKLKATE